jgi:SAM-dependent methyltransferase
MGARYRAWRSPRRVRCRRPVIDEPFAADRFGASRFDRVWILNCFEQLGDSRAVLGDVAAVLRPRGRVVIRTPNADFIRAAYRYECAVARRLLDANGLLGVPFLRCLNPEGVLALPAENGFGRFQLRGHALGSASPPDSPARCCPWFDVSAALGT